MHAMYTGLFRLKMGAKSNGGNTEVPILLVQFVSSCIPAAPNGHLKALRNLQDLRLRLVNVHIHINSINKNVDFSPSLLI